MAKTRRNRGARKSPPRAAAKRSTVRTPPRAPSTTTRVAQPPGSPGEALAKAGFDEAALSPKLRRTVLSLLAEVEELRHHLEDARSRIGALEKLVDEDPLMPVCNRRAFLRELTRMMAFAGRYGVPSSLVYFDVKDRKSVV